MRIINCLSTRDTSPLGTIFQLSSIFSRSTSPWSWSTTAWSARRGTRSKTIQKESFSSLMKRPASLAWWPTRFVEVSFKICNTLAFRRIKLSVTIINVSTTFQKLSFSPDQGVCKRKKYLFLKKKKKFLD